MEPGCRSPAARCATYDDLGNALDQLVAVAETGVRILPQVRGEESTLVDDGNVDIDVLEDVIADLRGVSTRLADAQAELADVADSRVVVGDRLAEARDQAQGEVDPLADGLETIDPLLDQLPKVLGRDASRQYLVALLNPAEMLYSGGTPQTFVPVDLDRGRLSMGETVDLSTAPGAAQPRYWRKVERQPAPPRADEAGAGDHGPRLGGLGQRAAPTPGAACAAVASPAWS